MHKPITEGEDYVKVERPSLFEASSEDPSVGDEKVGESAKGQHKVPPQSKIGAKKLKTVGDK